MPKPKTKKRKKEEKKREVENDKKLKNRNTKTNKLKKSDRAIAKCSGTIFFIGLLQLFYETPWPIYCKASVRIKNDPP